MTSRMLLYLSQIMMSLSNIQNVLRQDGESEV
jgi:hypothetical protein